MTPLALLSIALAAAAAQAAPAGARERAFVQADLLRVRAAPDAQAAIAARLRINTAVEIRERRGEWVRLSAPGGAEGWASASLLGPAPISPADALARASAGGSDALSWLERAAAAGPGSAEAWRALAAAAEAAGKPERARYARAVLAGEQPSFLAACEDGAVVLQAVHTAAAGFRRLRARPFGDGEEEESMTDEQIPLARETASLRRELPRLAEELPSAPWFRFGRGPLPGTPFTRPRFDELPLGCSEGEIDEIRDVLGSCEADERWMATTAPVRALAPEAPPIAEAGRLLGALAARGFKGVASVTTRSIPGTPPLVEARFTAKRAAGGGPEGVMGLALLGSGPEPIALVTRPHDGKGSIVSVGAPEWARLEVGPAARFAVVPFQHDTVGLDQAGKPVDGQSMTEWGFWIVFVDASGRARVHEVVTRVAQPC